ncbi:MAG TPA: hypothetical protein VFW09_16500 [Solirubrobacteraceae bacterium]|nr:hypothetical protein [Solirubrobacteraceae bacterium]
MGEELIGSGSVVAVGAPHDLAAAMVSDQGEVAALAFAGDLVDPDLKQVLPPVRIKLVGADALDDPPDRRPVDAHHPGDRRLFGLGIASHATSASKSRVNPARAAARMRRWRACRPPW